VGDNIAMLTHDTMRKLKVGDRVMVDTTTKYKDFNVPGLVNNSLGTIIKIDLISVYNSIPFNSTINHISSATVVY